MNAQRDIAKENKILQQLIAKQCGVSKGANASWPDLAEIFSHERANTILREAFIGILVVGGKCSREEAPDFIEKQIAGASERINAFEILHSQVCNGGFQQWLMNGYGELAEITIYTLEDIGTENALKVAEMVKKIITEVEINSDDKDFIYESEFCEYLDAQDTLFYELSDALQEEFKTFFGIC